MNSRISVVAAGVMILFGVFNLRQGIVSKKGSDITLGVICILGGAAMAAMMVLGGRR